MMHLQTKDDVTTLVEGEPHRFIDRLGVAVETDPAKVRAFAEKAIADGDLYPALVADDGAPIALFGLDHLDMATDAELDALVAAGPVEAWSVARFLELDSLEAGRAAAEWETFDSVSDMRAKNEAAVAARPEPETGTDGGGSPQGFKTFDLTPAAAIGGYAIVAVDGETPQSTHRVDSPVNATSVAPVLEAQNVQVQQVDAAANTIAAKITSIELHRGNGQVIVIEGV